LAESGIEFIEDNAPAALPSMLELPTISKSFACMDFEQSNTVINMSIDDLDIAMPSNDRITVALDFSVAGNGTLFADDLYACFGSATCQDSLNLDRGSAFLDFDLEIVGGKPHVVSRSIDVNVNPDNFDFALDGCGFTGSALTSAVNFTEGWILDYLEGKISDIAQDNLAPMLEQTLSGLSMDSNYLHASVEDVYFPNDGVSMTIDVGLTHSFDPVDCIAEYDDGGPKRAAGASVPNIQEGELSNVNMALNFGLLNDVFYTAWRQGLMCLNKERIKALGVDLDLNMIGSMMPGFPAGTEFGLDLVFTDYPRVRGAGENSNSLTVGIEGINLDVYGDRPDGTRNTMHAELSVEVTAKLAVSPGSNAIYAQLEDVKITHMKMEDERASTGVGFDVARIQQLVHDEILPQMINEMGAIPLTGPVFEVSNYAILLRTIATNKAYVSAGLDLFAIPANDNSAPDTRIVDAPAVSSVHSAVVTVNGSDAEIPSELLKYQVSVNGEAREPSYVRSIKIGEAGVTKNYDVRVAAVDLAGNVDPSPATATVLVDGIVPFVVVSGSRNRDADQGPSEITWTMSDDTTAAEALAVRVEVYELMDPADVLSARLMDTQVLAPGATSAIVNLESVGGLYRVEVHAVDEAGNDSRSSLLLSSASVGGCSTGGTSGLGGALFLLLAMGLVSLRRRQD